ncbi:MAG TPA: hypothetical protein DEP69_06540, partial [Acidimicrobiaceae bacterium]|nr:hypothetical protein [Acidimicrobiaceae bacterium]
PAGLTIAAARLLELAQTYIDERTSPTGARFDAWLRELTPADIDPAVGSAGTVDLVTFHAAKGLQWRHVVAAGTCAGVVPLVAGDPEERRLFYVAMTRAVDTLTLTWSADLGPSPWLADIAAVAAAADGAEAPVDPLERTVRLAEARARLDSAAADAADGSAAAAGGPAAAAAPDPATPTAEQTARRDRLTRWRSDAALARRIAPAAVLSDSSLAKISLRRPRTLDELVETTGQSRLRLRRVWEDLQEVLADD